ncbi:SMP-30/gluconolactonase/LRE family protein [Serratia ureilytica]
MTITACKIARVRADLGESPVWDAREGFGPLRRYLRGQDQRAAPAGRVETVHKSAARIGALELTDKGNLIFTEDACVAMLDVKTGEVCRHTAAAHDGASYPASTMAPAIAGTLCHRPHGRGAEPQDRCAFTATTAR